MGIRKYIEYIKQVKGLKGQNLEARLLRFKSCFTTTYVSLGKTANPSLCFGFLIWKIQIVIVSSCRGCYEAYMS